MKLSIYIIISLVILNATFSFAQSSDDKLLYEYDRLFKAAREAKKPANKIAYCLQSFSLTPISNHPDSLKILTRRYTYLGKLYLTYPAYREEAVDYITERAYMYSALALYYETEKDSAKALIYWEKYLITVYIIQGTQKQLLPETRWLYFADRRILPLKEAKARQFLREGQYFEAMAKFMELCPEHISEENYKYLIYEIILDNVHKTYNEAERNYKAKKWKESHQKFTIVVHSGVYYEQLVIMDPDITEIYTKSEDRLLHLRNKKKAPPVESSTFITHYNSAKTAQTQKEWSKALEEYNLALKVDPNNIKAKKGKREVVIAQNKELGNKYYWEHKWSRAIYHFEIVLGYENNEDIRKKLTKSYHHQGKETYERLDELDTANKQTQAGKMKSNYEFGRKYFKERNWNSTISYLEKVYKINPEYLATKAMLKESYYQLGIIERQNGNLSVATEYFNKSINEDFGKPQPTFTDTKTQKNQLIATYLYEARISQSNGEYDQALVYLDKIKGLDSNNKKEKELRQEIINQKKELFETYLSNAKDMQGIGKYDKALEYVQKAEELNIDNKKTAKLRKDIEKSR